MKRTSLALILSLAFTLAGPNAHAQMFLNPNGTGEVLLFPFYSAANGNDTYIHVVNTTGLVKATRVRFLEAHNGAEVLQFNLYLSPFDHWSGAITIDPTGDGAALYTIDTSCTVPSLGSPNPPFDGTVTVNDPYVVRIQPLVNFNYREDAPNDGIERTLQGYVEVIEMGQLEPGDAPNFFFDDYDEYIADDENDKGHAATHDRSGVPRGCQKLVNAWHPLSGAWTSDPADELEPNWQGGGLYGYGTLINVQDGTAAGFDAITIDNFIDPETVAGAIHQPVESGKPGWGDGISTVTITTAEGMADYEMDNGVDAVSGLFMSRSIMNEFVVNASIRGLTDWVLTQPTRRFYVGSPDNWPYRESWDGSAACEELHVDFWDREELFTEVNAGNCCITPRPPGPDPVVIEACTAVSIFGFGGHSASRSKDDISVSLNPVLGGVQSGWASFDFTRQAHHFLDTADDHVLFGLPVVGFSVTSYRNDDASALVPGVLAAYASTTMHKRKVLVQEHP